MKELIQSINPSYDEEPATTKPTVLECAVMSRLVYSSESEIKKQLGNSPWKLLDTLTLGVNRGNEGSVSSAKWSYEKNKVRCAVFYHDKRKIAVLAVKGTELTSLDDLKSDADIFLGKKPRLIELVEKFYEEKLSSFSSKAYSIFLTGHSLGAAVAEHLSVRMNLPCITFESPGVHFELSKKSHQSEMECYLTKPNFISCSGAHPGTVRRLDLIFPPTPAGQLVKQALGNKFASIAWENRGVIIDTLGTVVAKGLEAAGIAVPEASLRKISDFGKKAADMAAKKLKEPATERGINAFGETLKQHNLDNIIYTLILMNGSEAKRPLPENLTIVDECYTLEQYLKEMGIPLQSNKKMGRIVSQKTLYLQYLKESFSPEHYEDAKLTLEGYAFNQQNRMPTELLAGFQKHQKSCIVGFEAARQAAKVDSATVIAIQMLCEEFTVLAVQEHFRQYLHLIEKNHATLLQYYKLQENADEWNYEDATSNANANADIISPGVPTNGGNTPVGQQRPTGSTNAATNPPPGVANSGGSAPVAQGLRGGKKTLMKNKDQATEKARNKAAVFGVVVGVVVGATITGATLGVGAPAGAAGGVAAGSSLAAAIIAAGIRSFFTTSNDYDKTMNASSNKKQASRNFITKVGKGPALQYASKAAITRAEIASSVYSGRKSKTALIKEIAEVVGIKEKKIVEKEADIETFINQVERNTEADLVLLEELTEMNLKIPEEFSFHRITGEGNCFLEAVAFCVSHYSSEQDVRGIRDLLPKQDKSRYAEILSWRPHIIATSNDPEVKLQELLNIKINIISNGKIIGDPSSFDMNHDLKTSIWLYYAEGRYNPLLYNENLSPEFISTLRKDGITLSKLVRSSQFISELPETSTLSSEEKETAAVLDSISVAHNFYQESKSTAELSYQAAEEIIMDNDRKDHVLTGQSGIVPSELVVPVGNEPLFKGAFVEVHKAERRFITADNRLSEYNFSVVKYFSGDVNNNTLCKRGSQFKMLSSDPRYSPYLVRVLGIQIEPRAALYMEYLAGGTLDHRLYKNKEALTWETKLRWGEEIGRGLQYLHQQQVLHEDLRSANVGLSLQADLATAKIIDFGFNDLAREALSTRSQRVDATESSISVLIPAQWRAPERRAQGRPKRRPPATFSSDAYSYAMVLYELASRSIPFWDANNDESVIVDLSLNDDTRPPLEAREFSEIIKVLEADKDKPGQSTAYLEETENLLAQGIRAKEELHTDDPCPPGLKEAIKLGWKASPEERASVGDLIEKLSACRSSLFPAFTKISPSIVASQEGEEFEIGSLSKLFDVLTSRKQALLASGRDTSKERAFDQECADIDTQLASVGVMLLFTLPSDVLSSKTATSSHQDRGATKSFAM